MNMNQYINELNSIQASDSLKLKLKELANNPAIVYHKPKQSISKIKILSFAAMFLLVVVTVPTMLWLNNQNHIKDNAKPPSSISGGICGAVPPTSGSGDAEGSEGTSSTFPDFVDGLPTLTYVPDNPTLGTPFGFSLNKATDHPWKPSVQLTTMPVFKNKAKTDGSGVTTSGLTDEQLQQKIDVITKQLGVLPKKYEQITCGGTDNGYKEDDFFELTAICDNVKISVNRIGQISIAFLKPITLPYKVTPTQKYTRLDYECTIDFLYGQYKNILNIKNPQYNFDNSNYNEDDKCLTSLEIYEGSDNLTQTILGYHFKTAHFSLNENGELSGIWITETDLSEKLGDYPIVSEDEAKQILTQGNYKSWATNEPFSGDISLIEHTELVYHNERFEENFMPLYRFYVKIPEVKNENGLQAYNIYYVPAVEPRFMKNMPQPDMRFN
ncbi:hypothetical protein RBG61_10450 [Paludicola sp. MB14-C6]|uniref:hypothetical protein n=1 Tax=Paludihabitans sp. MB14-C6 TaxID=3070656 RepID=UPI0027DB4A93|nr:hypothetical protein [Paludicola sp. MB14-C6]WMJ22405.1 hypothetical protein RBG61_10450 [Paludicola sp. MB14-C6]